jgi:uncharacterized protein (DUF983 family)
MAAITYFLFYIVSGNCSQQNLTPMPKNQTACCPECGGRISFRKFVLLNNFSATNCECCNTRIEISNRDKNAVLAGISGCISATSIVLGVYIGEKSFQSWFLGLLSGVCFSTLLILFICRYAYRNSELNRIYRT